MSKKCSVRDGRFVDPCNTLEKAVDASGFSKAKGLYRHELYNTKTGEHSRTMFGLRAKDFPNGLLLNFCPWCGERIDAPFSEST